MRKRKINDKYVLGQNLEIFVTMIGLSVRQQLPMPINSKIFVFSKK